ncbi:MAG: hypothetical protein OET44_06235, partial [Gammaproteobacteria bacterium]|nr:hypothetical protein [Gammaproteobacteria bacterium]
TSNDDAVIRISSTQPVREPMLDVLIDVEWPGGHLQKQYTIFLDPPITARSLAAETPLPAEAGTVTSAPQPTPVPSQQPAATSTTVTATTELQEPTASAATATSEPAQPAQPAMPETYRVRPGDSLSRIADNFKKPMAVTRDQLMTAILDANPKAFIAGNINGLMGGMALTIPDKATVAGRTADAATALVQEQHQAWRDRSKPKPATTETELAEAPDETTGLRLVPTVQVPVTEAQPGTEASAAQLELTELETELLETRKLLYEREADLDVMRSRMAVYDAELQELKRQLVEVRDEVVAKAPVEVEASAPVDSTIQPTDIKTLLIALIAVLGGFGLFSIIWRRLTARAAPAESAQMAPLPLEINESLAALDEAEDEEEEDEVVEDEPATIVPKELTLRENSHVNADSPTEVREILADPHPGAATADRMLVEADVLIQFGFLQRGQDLLNEALSSDPGNPHYRLKLMELCQEADDRKGFREHAELLRERITPADAELWVSAAKMTGALFPGDPLFSADDFSAQHVAVGGEPTPGKDADWDPLSTQEIPKLSGGGEFLNLDEVLESPADDGQLAKTRDWEFQAPGAESGERAAAPGAGPDGTSEWLLPDDQLDSFEDAADDSTDSGQEGVHRRGQVEVSARRELADDDANREYSLRSGDAGEPPDGQARTERWVTGNNPAGEHPAADVGGTQELHAVQPPEPRVPDEPGAVTGELEALSDLEPSSAAEEAKEPDPRMGEARVIPSDEFDEARRTTRDWQVPEAGGGETQTFPSDEIDGPGSTTRDWRAPEASGDETQAFPSDEVDGPGSTTRDWRAPEATGDETQAFPADETEGPENATRDWQVPDELHPPEPGGDTQAFSTGETQSSHDDETSGTTRDWQVPDELHPPEPGGDTQAFDTGEHQSDNAERPRARQSKPRKKRRKRKSR